jgi:hypothetical protein
VAPAHFSISFLSRCAIWIIRQEIRQDALRAAVARGNTIAPSGVAARQRHFSVLSEAVAAMAAD